MEDKTLNERESLELISRMIQNTHNRLGGSIGSIYLGWGYISLFVTALVVVFQLVLNHYTWNWLWFLIPGLGLPLTWALSRRDAGRAVTFVDRAITYAWMVVGFVCILITLTGMLIDYRIPIFPVICILLTTAITQAGLIARYTPLTVGGIVGILLSLGMFFTPGHGFWPVILYAAMIVAGMIVPGHMMKCDARRQPNLENHV